jgi:hypothetical protein
MQRGEGELHLGLDTGRARHPAVRCPLSEIVQQSGFSNSCLAVYHQRSAFAGADNLDELVDNLAFGSSAD